MNRFINMLNTRMIQHAVFMTVSCKIHTVRCLWYEYYPTTYIYSCRKQEEITAIVRIILRPGRMSPAAMSKIFHPLMWRLEHPCTYRPVSRAVSGPDVAGSRGLTTTTMTSQSFELESTLGVAIGVFDLWSHHQKFWNCCEDCCEYYLL